MSIERQDHVRASIGVPRPSTSLSYWKTNASKEGLGAVLSQKQDDGRYHPVAFGSRMLTSSEQNYHSSKLKFLALRWSVTEHFKEYLAYAPFTVCTDNNPSNICDDNT